jgi:CheY-like chemotaxis protein
MTSKTTPKVLIVDDDSRNIFALQAILTAKKFSCLTALSGAEGLEIIAREPSVAVLLLDMMMPEMDGYETLLRIRAGNRKDIPVIAVTAQAMAGDRQKCLDAGATEYVSKPINVDKLISLLEYYVR